MSTKPEPSLHHDDEHPELSARNARSGWWLFLIYLLLYGGFVGLNAFAPDVMSQRPLAGVNVAILYGLALILAAFILALVYMFLCKQAAIAHAAKIADPTNDSEGGSA